eukprot:768802-Hanusia_phi.AAC.20
MSPTMEDTIGKLQDYVNETTPRPKPVYKPYEGYEPTFKQHYPKFYKSLMGGYKENENAPYKHREVNGHRNLMLDPHGVTSVTVTVEQYFNVVPLATDLYKVHGCSAARNSIVLRHSASKKFTKLAPSGRLRPGPPPRPGSARPGTGSKLNFRGKLAKLPLK